MATMGATAAVGREAGTPLGAGLASLEGGGALFSREAARSLGWASLAAALAEGAGGRCSLRKAAAAGGWGFWGLRRWAGFGGTSGAPSALGAAFFFSAAGAGPCSALSGMVPAMLSGLGLRGGGRGRITTEEDIWLDAADCSEATDRDERGRDGDGCSFPAAAPPVPIIRWVARSCEARVGRGATASWLMLRAERSLPALPPAEAPGTPAPRPGSTMLWDMGSTAPATRLEGGLPPDRFSMLLAILGGVAEVLADGGRSRRLGCASRSRRDMLTARWATPVPDEAAAEGRGEGEAPLLRFQGITGMRSVLRRPRLCWLGSAVMLRVMGSSPGTGPDTKHPNGWRLRGSAAWHKL